MRVYRYTCLGTIEERIEAILREKQRDFADLVEDVSLDLSGRLTRAELLGLFEREG